MKRQKPVATMITLMFVLLAKVPQVEAEMQVRDIAYELGNTQFQGVLVYDDSVKTPRPGVMMVPNWMGVTDAAREKAKLVAGQDYVVFVADLYGKDVRPQNADEAKVAAGAVRADRPMMRQRAQKAVDVLKSQTDMVNIDLSKIAAIGFCFGGGSVLELARSGSNVAGVVSFHGNLDTPNPVDAKNAKAKILVLHGADDPTISPEQLQGFIQEMKDAGTDWQLVQFGGAVHSFTDPGANNPGRNQYNPVVAKRAFAMMHDFFDELFKAESE